MESNLPVNQLQLVAEMAAQGLGEASIRNHLKLTPDEWRDLTKNPRPGVRSPLAQAIHDGRSRIVVEEALAVIIQAAAGGDVASARYLVDRFGGKGISNSNT
jgi:hypothetical protein